VVALSLRVIIPARGSLSFAKVVQLGFVVGKGKSDCITHIPSLLTREMASEPTSCRFDTYAATFVCAKAAPLTHNAQTVSDSA
jgi:hypothetical protein